MDKKNGKNCMHWNVPPDGLPGSATIGPLVLFWEVSILFEGSLFFWGVSIFFLGGGGGGGEETGSFVSVHFIWGVLCFWEGCPFHSMGVVFLLEGWAISWG